MLGTLPGSIEASGGDKDGSSKTIANGKRICYILDKQFKQCVGKKQIRNYGKSIPNNLCTRQRF
jgi:hypothetical protein